MRFENCLVLFDCESESSILLERKKSPCHSVNDRHLVWHTRIILDNKYLTIHSCYFCKKEREKCKKSQELFENHGNENIYFSWFLVLVGACNAFEDETDKLSMTTKTTWVWQLQRGYLILESFSHKFDFFQTASVIHRDKPENDIFSHIEFINFKGNVL